MLEIKWAWSRSSCVLFVLIFIGEQWQPIRGGSCLCWDDMNSTVREELRPLSAPDDLGPYEYAGLAQEGDTYKSCTCLDVSRLEGVLTLVGGNESAAQNGTDIEAHIKEAIGMNGTLMDKVSSVDVELVNATEAPTSVWKVQLVYKGRRETSGADTITTEFLAEITTSGKLVLDGEIDIGTPEIQFQVVQCTGAPPDHPENGDRVWEPTQQYPGDVAKYLCNTGYVVNDEETTTAKCKHESLEWEKTLPDKNMTCQKGCATRPPNGPFFSSKSWDAETSKYEGSNATYYCMNGYRSTTGINGTSTCTNTVWSTVTAEFTCDQILCSRFIPQVPAHGRTNWDNVTVYIGTRIKYTCMTGYSSTKGVVLVECDKEGNWTPYAEGFDCLNREFAMRIGIYDDDFIKPYDYYETEDDKPQESYNWFWIVTFPGIIALVLIIFCCLCCTRTDSPLFVLCTGNTKNVSYVPDK